MTSRKRGSEMISPKPTPVAIATIMRPEGYTGVQTHTRVLHSGIAQAGFPCSVLTPSSGSKWKWFPVFAVPTDPPLSTQQELVDTMVQALALRCPSRESPAASLWQPRQNTHRTMSPKAPWQHSKLGERLGADLKIALVCHFTVSQAEEYREKGELNDEVTVKKIWDLEKQVIRSVDVVIHNSDWQRSTLEGCRGIRPKSSTVIWLGIPATVPDRSVTRRDFGLSPDDLILINVGSLEPRKNQLGLARPIRGRCLPVTRMPNCSWWGEARRGRRFSRKSSDMDWTQR